MSGGLAAALTVTPATEVRPGMVVGGFAWSAPGGRCLANLTAMMTVESVHMEPAWDGARYLGQRVTLTYFGGRGPSVLDGSDTVCVVEATGPAVGVAS